MPQMETPTDRVGIGIIGAGVISDIYLRNLTGVMPNTRVVAIADLLVERAQARAESYEIEACSVEELLAHPDISIVVNLTIPKAHASVARQVVAAGKSVYNEKPLTLSRDEAAALLETAQQQGVLVGCAPDTFLGGGLQTARQVIDAGLIGTPVAASAAMLAHGHESWHPDPVFYYQPGAGPMLDMGPYYVTALVSLLGPVTRVVASSKKSFPERTITSQPKAGENIAVNVDTHIAATLDFASGVTATLVTSFDTWETNGSQLTIYGSDGTLRLPDPNTFGGPLKLLRAGTKEWEDVPLTHGWTENSRGLGVSDLARALREGGTPRASGELAAHVLDVMYATLESSAAERFIRPTTTISRPEPLSTS
jgi:predicted dehydrogenase